MYKFICPDEGGFRKSLLMHQLKTKYFLFPYFSIIDVNIGYFQKIHKFQYVHSFNLSCREILNDFITHHITHWTTFNTALKSFEADGEIIYNIILICDFLTDVIGIIRSRSAQLVLVISGGKCNFT